MSEQPLVSIVIPCYNRGEFIAETIASVLNQSYPHIELIVVDDGSTDNSREIVDSFAEQITILEHPGRVNKGQSAALNLGIRASHGKYIAFLDSDDLFLPDKIEKQVRFLENNPHIGLVYGNGHAIDAEGKVLYPFYSSDHYEASDPNRILLDCYFLLPNNSLLKREVLEASGGFDETLRAAQDHDLLIRIAEVTNIAYINDFIFLYRRHKNSISQRSAMLRWKNGFIILRKAHSRYKYPVLIKLRRLAVLNFRVAQCYREEQRWVPAVFFFCAAGLCDPIRSAHVFLGKEKISSPH